MLHLLTLSFSLAALATAQETTTTTTPINPQTLSPMLPSVTVNSSALTSTTATISGSTTTLACVPESDLVFSIQTDTNLSNEPASTPVCGQSTTSYALPGPITNSSGNLTITMTSSATVSMATTGSSGASSSAPVETQSGNPAAKNALGGMAGVVGLAAGMVFL
ncbi:uncharacterized protein MYCFIDRAFT_212702 [Pseudocercospora fijiensis CIRAD86]|uniref:GPI anchored protein n=1 Tax=Pseudocercospora fijiensis (strain CIRAD86) TaxID=383855 RepID=M2ZE84_PSEFD|nr:uncharacterized protein MYCFIDRAFT_212702 [Pseudocercospora fijiensis CIRAD86]EME77439.1 hypothetical protein MYCFIDRAFT_212702 [Pseudocercospora fijiensis CIRAD86]